MSEKQAEYQIRAENESGARPAGGDGAASSSPAPEVSRPALRYHGGKWRLAPWIIGHLPRHKAYVEPFGGAMSVLLRKAPAYTEVYNDLDACVVNFFRVLRDDQKSSRLRQQLAATPFSRVEFEQAWQPAECDVERARRLVVRSFMGYSTVGVTGKVRDATRTGFRASCHRQGVTPAHNWAGYPQAIDAFRARLDGVVIECRDAFEVIEQQDRPHTLFYIDPPYVQATRGERWQSEGYAHDMTASGHEALAELLRSVAGMVVLSGYRSELYRDLYEAHGWKRSERGARADGGRARTECLYLNPAAQKWKPQQSLFQP